MRHRPKSSLQRSVVSPDVHLYFHLDRLTRPNQIKGYYYKTSRRSKTVGEEKHTSTCHSGIYYDLPQPPLDPSTDPWSQGPDSDLILNRLNPHNYSKNVPNALHPTRSIRPLVQTATPSSHFPKVYRITPCYHYRHPSVPTRHSHRRLISLWNSQSCPLTDTKST